MMQNQMQMSTIETNTATIDAMKSLQTSFFKLHLQVQPILLDK